MKYNFFYLPAVIILSGCAVLNSSLIEESSSFTGTSQGYRGNVTVLVHMSGNQIIDIEIIDSADDRSVGRSAMEELAELVIMYNSTDIDAITGATESSRGFLKAVENAILSE